MLKVHRRIKCGIIFNIHTGSCIAPNACQCKPGYALVQNFCSVSCIKQCTNGRCIAQNTCGCLNGYKLKSDNQFECEPVCEPPCSDGTCVKPSECKCKSGLINDLLDSSKCIPRCKIACIGGTCLQSGKYKLEYRKDVYSVIQFKYFWLVESIHRFWSTERARSISLGHNSRWLYLVWEVVVYAIMPDDLIWSFLPPRPPSTILSRIIERLTADFFQHEKWKKKPVEIWMLFSSSSLIIGKCECPKGLKSVSQKDHVQCVTFCDKPCGPQMFCSINRTCECFKGYLKEGDGCKPICSSECVNGRCTAPEFCDCDKGFVHDPANRMVCIPHCTKYCVNANCTTRQCECHDNYHSLEDYPNVCVPTCKKACRNGYCNSPNECACNVGYTMEEEVCKPVCSVNCTNGDCMGPEVCRCKEGYEVHNKNR